MSAAVVDPATGPQDLFLGYDPAELAVFDRFAGRRFAPEPGFITDFLGVRTRASFLAGYAAPDGIVLGLPVPTDNVHADAVEWIGFLKSVLSARERFVAIELGAGWAPWLVAAAASCRVLGITDLHFAAVEADPGHMAFLRTHFRDNGLDPDTHMLIEAAVGLRAGHARWPHCPHPSAEWALRPVLGLSERHDHLGRAVERWIDVEVVALDELLRQQERWDLVHMDVQGSEADLCEKFAGELTARVRWLVVGTHDYGQHARVLQAMFSRGWRLENEKPPRMRRGRSDGAMQVLTEVDGTLVWSNDRLA